MLRANQLKRDRQRGESGTSEDQKAQLETDDRLSGSSLGPEAQWGSSEAEIKVPSAIGPSKTPGVGERPLWEGASHGEL